MGANEKRREGYCSGDREGPYMQIGRLAKKCIKYGLGGEKDKKENNHLIKMLCRDPGSNRGPLDLQSNALPTELSRQLLLDKRVCTRKPLRLKICEKFVAPFILYSGNCNAGCCF